MAAVAWMNSYFSWVGDKRPDKDGIYLPSCLSEKSIYNLMIEDFDQINGGQDHCVCLSQFNRLFRTHFPNVTIPKVTICPCIVSCLSYELGVCEIVMILVIILANQYSSFLHK